MASLPTATTPASPPSTARSPQATPLATPRQGHLLTLPSPFQPLSILAPRPHSITDPPLVDILPTPRPPTLPRAIRLLSHSPLLRTLKIHLGLPPDTPPAILQPTLTTPRVMPPQEPRPTILQETPLLPPPTPLTPLTHQYTPLAQCTPPPLATLPVQDIPPLQVGLVTPPPPCTPLAMPLPDTHPQSQPTPPVSRVRRCLATPPHTQAIVAPQVAPLVLATPGQGESRGQVVTRPSIMGVTHHRVVYRVQPATRPIIQVAVRHTL